MGKRTAKDFYEELKSDLGTPPFLVDLVQSLVSLCSVGATFWLLCAMWHDTFETDYSDTELKVWIAGGIIVSLVTGIFFSHYYPKRWSLSDAVARNMEDNFDIFGIVFGFVVWCFFGLSYALRDLFKRSKFKDQELRLAANVLSVIQMRAGMDMEQLAEQLRGSASMAQLKSVERLLKRHGYVRQEVGLTLIGR